MKTENKHHSILESTLGVRRTVNCSFIYKEPYSDLLQKCIREKIKIHTGKASLDQSRIEFS